jgi:hypothetical protein
MAGAEKCQFCKKEFSGSGSPGVMVFSGGDLSGMFAAANSMLARKFVCPSCSSVFCLECGNKKGHSLNTGSTHCPKCGTKVL